MSTRRKSTALRVLDITDSAEVTLDGETLLYGPLSISVGRTRPDGPIEPVTVTLAGQRVYAVKVVKRGQVVAVVPPKGEPCLTAKAAREAQLHASGTWE